ncbi:MAG: hypothetical protein ACYTGL_20960 [Planctomycetota bacterium]|jgi:hypothetical protein
MRPRLLIVSCAIALVSLAGAANGAPQSVQDFLKLKPRWDKMVGLKFLIEGRFGGSTGEFVNLRKLPLAFRAGERLTRRYDGDDVLHLMGELQRDENGRLYFRLLDLKKGRKDLERMQSLTLDLPPKEHAPVYELADWAFSRAEFYNDSDLKAEATKLYDRGLRREQGSLEKRDYQSYRQLALKAERYGLGEKRKHELLYEGHYREWRLIRQTADAKQLAGLATAIATELPGAAVPVPIIDEEFRNDWKAEPLRFYETATFGHDQMHRFLYQEIMLEGIMRSAQRDGRNGRNIAKRLRTDLPELRELASEFVTRELDWQVNNVTTLSVDEMQALREALIEADEAERADKALNVWFRDRETKLRNEDVDGMIELASLHETLFPDGARDAVKVLLEAERRRPGVTIVRQRLESHGYRLIDGDWKSSEEVRDFENSPINRAMREGRVIPGMTQEQVRRALGKPTSVSRLLTAKHVIEYWVYGETSRSSRLTIRLSRPTQRSSAIVVQSREVPN